jgi:hypothetical protein
MITFVSWLWVGWRPVYKPEHVYALRNMLAEHYKKPHRFVCVTDQKLEGVETIPPWYSPIPPNTCKAPDCYQRLKLFADFETFGNEAVSIDLDCVILDDITELIDSARSEPFKILGGTVCPYNGSIWYVRPGVNPQVWTDLTPADTIVAKNHRMPDGRRPYGSDQTYMAFKMQNAPTWGRADGIYQYVWGNRRKMDRPKIVFFAGRMKPWAAPEFRDDYERFKRL